MMEALWRRLQSSCQKTFNIIIRYKNNFIDKKLTFNKEFFLLRKCVLVDTNFVTEFQNALSSYKK